MRSPVSAPTVDSLFRPVIEAAISSIWQQWADVGGTAAGGGSPRWLIDPEALLLASEALAPRERRLQEVMEAWLRQHADVLSVQRLTNLANRTDEFPRHNPAAIAAIAMQGPNGHRWKRLAGARPGTASSSFHLRSTPPLGLTAPSTAMVRLRLAMGVGVKADALSFLIGTRTWQSVPEVTRATGYTVAGVRRALDELAQARFIDSEEPVEWQTRRTRHFRVDSSQWHALLHFTDESPAWGYFRERFDFVVHISQWMDEHNGAQQWNAVQLGDWGKRWMVQHPLAFRLDEEDRAAYRGTLGDWAEHFKESLRMLTAWFGGGEVGALPAAP